MLSVAAPSIPSPEDPYFKRWIAAHGRDAWESLDRLPSLDPARALVILKDLVERACTAQNAANINLGRWGLLRMPRTWVLSHIEAMIDPLFVAEHDWEYRRAVELAALLNPQLLITLLAHGDRSSSPGIREAAADWRR